MVAIRVNLVYPGLFLSDQFKRLFECFSRHLNHSKFVAFEMRSLLHFTNLNKQITSENNIYQLEKRLTTVERYQNRPFLIFTKIDIPAHGNVLAPILQIVNNNLEVILNPDEISIANPLKMEKLRMLLVNFCICNKGT